MVDLSKAQKGDKVKFRCGGEAVIFAVEPSEYEKSRTWLQFVKEKRIGAGYGPDGRQSTAVNQEYEGPFDIIAIEPAPFDWSTVKPGMAFKNINYKLLYYVGTDSNGRAVFDFSKSPSFSDSKYDVFGGKDAHLSAHLTRIPEFDV